MKKYQFLIKKQILEKAIFNNFPLENTLEKQTKTFKDEGRKLR